MSGGLFRVQVYSEYRFIQSTGLFRVQVYSEYMFIQSTGLFRVQVYSEYRFIQIGGLFVKTHFRGGLMGSKGLFDCGGLINHLRYLIYEQIIFKF